MDTEETKEIFKLYAQVRLDAFLPHCSNFFA